MGHVRHHGILVTAWNEDHLKIAHQKATDIFKQLVSDIRESHINGYDSFAIFYSFAVVPDGSNEWWPDSNAGDANRAAFLAWLRKQESEERYYDWVEVQYGDDGGETRIISDSDHPEKDGE